MPSGREDRALYDATISASDSMSFPKDASEVIRLIPEVVGEIGRAHV